MERFADRVAIDDEDHRALGGIIDQRLRQSDGEPEPVDSGDRVASLAAQLAADIKFFGHPPCRIGNEPFDLVCLDRTAQQEKDAVGAIRVVGPLVGRAVRDGQASF